MTSGTGFRVTQSGLQPLAILGGGPVGLTLALLLAKRSVASIVFDARTLEQARTDQRVLALSLGSLQTLRAFVELPATALAPIRSVIVSSVGDFGRAVLDDDELGAEILGATIRYGDLVATLSAAAEANELITLRRPHKVVAVRQSPSSVELELENVNELENEQRISASLAISAEGFGHTGAASVSHAAVVADLELTGIGSDQAFERFTREGPLALLPLPSSTAATRRRALVWCMKTAEADRRIDLEDSAFIDELIAHFSESALRVVSLHARRRYPLHEQARDQLVEHRMVYLGNAAQTLHPVAGQGLNLGLRDSVALAEQIGLTHADARDPVQALHRYAQSRRVDRAAIVALTRFAPAFFSTRFSPIALARSIGLTALAVVPKLRREFARLLMFGVRF